MQPYHTKLDFTIGLINKGMATLTYSLRKDSDNSDGFYEALTYFTDHILNEANLYLGKLVIDYKMFISENNIESTRSVNEYTLEALYLGLFYKTYVHKSSRLSLLQFKILKTLYKWRSAIASLKPFIDSIRGKLSENILDKENPNYSTQFTKREFNSLLNWLEATGEFREEVARLRNWQLFLNEKADTDLAKILSLLFEFAIRFQRKAKGELGCYTENVDSFCSKNYEFYKGREDKLFCLRTESEYHLNMVGAEILNRELKVDFKQTTHKILLVPTCMAKHGKNACQAKLVDGNLSCMHCSTNCQVNKLSKTFSDSVQTILIPHSSDFSRWLKKWRGQRDVGLIGVACVLNLLTGGYEMINLEIPSQCVFLDYCGCKNHWDQHGIPTQLNENKLVQLIN